MTCLRAQARGPASVHAATLALPPGVTRVVVGHSVQAGGQITSACGSVWRIDVGLSKGVLNSEPQVWKSPRKME